MLHPTRLVTTLPAGEARSLKRRSRFPVDDARFRRCRYKRSLRGDCHDCRHTSDSRRTPRHVYEAPRCSGGAPRQAVVKHHRCVPGRFGSPKRRPRCGREGQGAAAAATAAAEVPAATAGLRPRRGGGERRRNLPGTPSHSAEDLKRPPRRRIAACDAVATCPEAGDEYWPWKHPAVELTEAPNSTDDGAANHHQRRWGEAAGEVRSPPPAPLP